MNEIEKEKERIKKIIKDSWDKNLMCINPYHEDSCECYLNYHIEVLLNPAVGSPATWHKNKQRKEWIKEILQIGINDSSIRKKKASKIIHIYPSKDKN